jgi:hypothetical protein
MSSPKNGVDFVGIYITHVKIEQSRLHGIKPFEAFFEKDLMELSHINRHISYPRFEFSLGKQKISP